ncbi:hypothetical protein [Cohnella soli]|uniref:Uncharacterized protein n=1 Tax=Cohnella soli TaxID=425005 RepID=A0ABW0HN09_9BACL
MAYRTYKEIFRVRAEVSSLGTGVHRVVLPEWCTITLDVVIIIALSLPITVFIIAPLPNLFISAFLHIENPILKWIEGFLMSAALAFWLHKKEAAGKTPLQYLGTLVGFILRSTVNSWHDGWDTTRIELQTHKNVQIRTYRFDERECGSLPAVGVGVKRFTLTSAAAVKVRGDKILFTKSGKRLEPGEYQVEGKKIVPVQTEARRQPPSLRDEEDLD